MYILDVNISPADCYIRDPSWLTFVRTLERRPDSFPHFKVGVDLNLVIQLKNKVKERKLIIVINIFLSLGVQHQVGFKFFIRWAKVIINL